MIAVPKACETQKGSRLKRMLKIGQGIVTGSLLVTLILSIGWRSILETLASTDWRWVFAGYCLFAVNRGVQSSQMAFLLEKVGASISMGRVFLANSLASFYSLVLPGDAIAALLKWSDLSAATGKKSIVLNAIAYNRLSLLLPVFVCGSVSLLWEDPDPSSPLAEAISTMVLLFVVVGVCAYHPRVGVTIDRMVRSAVHPLPESITTRVEMILKSLQRFRQLAPAQHLTVFALSSVSFAISVGTFFCILAALGLNVPITAACWAISLNRLSRQLPLTINNIGIKEGILIIVLGPYGVTPSQVMAMSVISLGKKSVIALIGAAYQICLMMGWAKWSAPPKVHENAPIIG